MGLNWLVSRASIARLGNRMRIIVSNKFAKYVSKFSVQIDYNLGWACKKYRNEEEMKTQEEYPAAERSW